MDNEEVVGEGDGFAVLAGGKERAKLCCRLFLGWILPPHASGILSAKHSYILST